MKIDIKMKRAFQFAILPVAISAAVVWNHGKRPPASEMTSESASGETAASTSAASRTPAAATAVAAPAPMTPRTPGAAPASNSGKLAALEDMTKTLSQYTQPDMPLKDLVQYLESSRQQPMVTSNTNPATGEMVIVRTESPLPGTRYFHAQYFADENNQSFVQHMSFEFQPSETAMNEAISAVERSFPDLPAPEMRNANFVQWNLKNGYIVWVKKMDSNDLLDNPFNAYTKEDVGTVRVAVEMNIHD